MTRRGRRMRVAAAAGAVVWATSAVGNDAGFTPLTPIARVDRMIDASVASTLAPAFRFVEGDDGGLAVEARLVAESDDAVAAAQRDLARAWSETPRNCDQDVVRTDDVRITPFARGLDVQSFVEVTFYERLSVFGLKTCVTPVAKGLVSARIAVDPVAAPAAGAAPIVVSGEVLEISDLQVDLGLIRADADAFKQEAERKLQELVDEEVAKLNASLADAMDRAAWPDAFRTLTPTVKTVRFEPKGPDGLRIVAEADSPVDARAMNAILQASTKLGR